MTDSKQTNSFKEKTMELVQLDNGDIVLRDIDIDEEPMIRFSFSDNISHFLEGAKLDITRAMLEAGIQRHQELLAEKQALNNPADSGYLH